MITEQDLPSQAAKPLPNSFGRKKYYAGLLGSRRTWWQMRTNSKQKSVIPEQMDRPRSSGTRITEENIDEIGFEIESEKEFARLLLHINPDLEITYEPQRFIVANDEGKQKEAFPDFSIHNPESGYLAYIEITTRPKNDITYGNNGYYVKEKKSEQRETMKKAAPNIPYIVFYQKDLARLQEQYPTFNLFSIRRLYKPQPKTKAA